MSCDIGQAPRFPPIDPASSHYILGFGEGFEEGPALEVPPAWQRGAFLIVGIAAPIIGSITIGVFIATTGAVVGGLISVTTFLAPVATVQSLQHAYRYRFQRTLTEPISPPPSQGGVRLGKYVDADVRLSEPTEDSFEWKLKLIRSAKESIEMSPNFAGGPLFQKVLDAIQRRMKETSRLKTHLLISSDLLEERDTARLEELKRRYRTRFSYLITPRIHHLFPTPHTEENHVKLLVVDGRYFVSGGTGVHTRLSQEHPDPTDARAPSQSAMAMALAPSLRDCDVIGKSDALGPLLREQFFRLYQIWETRTGNSPSRPRFFPINSAHKGECVDFERDDPQTVRNAKIKLLVSGPEHATHNPITSEYVKRIEKAKHSIRLANFLLDFGPTIREALEGARRRNGVRIVGYSQSGRDYLPSLGATMRSRHYYSLFDEMHEYSVSGQSYHKKTALFDNSHLLCGSYNHGSKSERFDHELVFVIKSVAIATMYKKVLQEDARRSTLVTRSTIQDNASCYSFLGNIASTLFGNYM